MNRYESHREWPAYQLAMQAAMDVYELTKRFPAEEKAAMVEQVRRSSRAICAIIAEAWRKRRYRSRFVAKLSDAEGQAEETRVWLEFAGRCGHLAADTVSDLDARYVQIIDQLGALIWEPDYWYMARDGGGAGEGHGGGSGSGGAYPAPVEGRPGSYIE
jgi:four helix bundle protein